MYPTLLYSADRGDPRNLDLLRKVVGMAKSALQSKGIVWLRFEPGDMTRYDMVMIAEPSGDAIAQWWPNRGVILDHRSFCDWDGAWPDELANPFTKAVAWDVYRMLIHECGPDRYNWTDAVPVEIR